MICPHCQEFVWIQELNCGIFRHGVFKHNFEQIPPHASKEDCDRFVIQGQIYGCGKPFQITRTPDWKITICEYI